METIRTEINYREQDYKNAYKVISTSQFPLKSRLGLFLGLAFTIAALVWAYYDFVVQGYSLSGFKNWLPHFFLLLTGILGLLMHFFLLSSTYGGEEAKVKRSYNFIATPEGFELEGKGGYAGYKWQEMEKVLSAKNVMLFVITGNQFYIIPRHSFSPEQWKQLKVWVGKLV